MFVGKAIVAYGLLFFILKRIHIIRKTTVFFLLFTLWSIAYLYSPYWHAFGAFGFPGLKYVAFVFLFLYGLLWAYLSANDLKLPKIRIYPFTSFFLILSFYLVNYRQLNADIPWRGDEDGHIIMLLRLKKYLSYFLNYINTYLVHNPVFWVFLFILFFVLFLFYKRRNGSHPFIISSFLLLIALPALILFSDRSFTDQRNIFFLSDVLWYPFIQKWISFFFVLPNFYDISLYRIVPFLSLIGIASFLFYGFYRQLQSKALAFLFSLAFTTVPLLLYYSSILYLEMPVVFFMTFCTGNIKRLIQEDIDSLSRHYVWYTLLILSFLKESALLFLLIIVVSRISYQFYNRYKVRKISRSFVLPELRFLLVTLSPVVAFVMFRTVFLRFFDASTRISLANIFSLSNYAVIVQTYVNQIGILPILAAIGLVIFYKKDKLSALMILLLFIGTLILYLGFQRNNYTLLVGYSRWNLYLLPMILFAASYFVIYISRRGKMYSVILLVIIFLFNFLLFPFKSDGVRLSGWGAPRMDVGEYTYPYDEAVRFLSNEKVDTILLFGQYSPYLGIRYYLEKYNFHPKLIEYHSGPALFGTRFDEEVERKKLDQFFAKTPSCADAILYHSVNNIDLDIDKVYGGKYIIKKRIQNSLHSIYIFIDKDSAIL